jgi:hypothetical protein
MATPIGAFAAVTTTWILIGRGNVATGHVIRSRRQHLATTRNLSGVGLSPRVQVRGRSWSSVAVDVSTDVGEGARRSRTLIGCVSAREHLISSQVFVDQDPKVGDGIVDDGQVIRKAGRNGQILHGSRRVTGTEPAGPPPRSTATTHRSCTLGLVWHRVDLAQPDHMAARGQPSTEPACA